MRVTGKKGDDTSETFLRPAIAPVVGKRSAGVIPVRFAAGPEGSLRWRYLLLRAYSYWDFPKGGIDAPETEREAALRELREETGISRARFLADEAFYETESYSRGKIARYYLGEVFTDEVKFGINPVLGHAEHHAYRWFEYDDAVKVVVPRVRKALDWAEAHVRALRAERSGRL